MLGLLPAEKIVLFGMVAAALCVAAGFPLLLPASQGGEVMEQLTGTTNYFVILFSAVGFYLLLFVSQSLKEKRFNARELVHSVSVIFRVLFATCIATYLMLSFKWWSHLRGIQYDEIYYSIDLQLAGITSAFMNASLWMGLSDDMYFYLFTLLFISAYVIVMILNPAWFCRLLTASIAVMVIGGMGYMIAPAYGPLIYRDNVFFMDTQAQMRAATDAFRLSNGLKFDASKFEYVLGAMPSLHIAHTLVIALYASALNRRLAVPYLLIFVYIFMHASVTGFHYLIDLPAGVLVAALAIIVTEKLHKKPYLKSWDLSGNLRKMQGGKS